MKSVVRCVWCWCIMRHDRLGNWLCEGCRRQEHYVEIAAREAARQPIDTRASA